jgi:hypothetical protein
MTTERNATPDVDRVSISGALLGTPLAMLGSALMLSIVGFPIGIVLFAAGISMMTTSKAAARE